MRKIQIINLIFCVMFFTHLNAQTKYFVNAAKTEVLFYEIKDIENSNFKTAIEGIKTEIQNKIPYSSYNEKMFNSLIFIPIYNVQLKILNMNKISVGKQNIEYYFKLINYQPINRILIFNNKVNYIGTMYFFEERNFILYNLKDAIFFNYQCQEIEDKTINKYLPFIKKQIFSNPLPIYFVINNFSKELFYINKKDMLFIVNKRQSIKTDIYFGKNYIEQKFKDNSKDSSLKYINHKCLSIEDTTKAINVH